MWSNGNSEDEAGNSEDEARDNWLREYDQPNLYLAFDQLLQQRQVKLNDNTDQPQQSSPRIERPATVDFPYRGKLYRLETSEGLPKRHIVLPNGTVLVVCNWNGRVPSPLADIRRGLDMSPAQIAEQLDGILAEENPLLLGQTTKAMAILDFNRQRYAVDYDANAALLSFPDGTFYRIESHYPEEPQRIGTIVPFDATNVSQLKTCSKTPAISVASDYPGMAHAPRDLRIRFSFQGERYILSHETYEERKGIVFIPDHGFFRIGTYLKSMPVQLGGLQPLSSTPTSFDHVAVALRLADAVDVDANY